MTLGEKQRLFMQLVARLIVHAANIGYEVTGGDLYRDPRVHGKPGEKLGYGHRDSCHKYRLAIDLNLFKDGVYLDKTSDHKELGEWWEKQHELCRWGGRWDDGNHYSMTHNSVA